MDDNAHIKTIMHQGTVRVVAAVSRDDFSKRLLEFVAGSARLRNFGVFYTSNLRRVEPVLSVWSGKISDYWFRRNASEMLTNVTVQNDILERIRNSPRDGVHIERWHPPAQDPRYPIYKRAKVLERIGVSSRIGRGGYQSFFLRSTAHGWITDEEFSRLEDVLPLAHELIGLHHRIVGSQSFRFTSGQTASSLRERNVPGFVALSEREAQVCDCLVRGVTVAGTALEMGIAETSVRTFRRRAYRKLQVSSANELMALMLHDN